MHTTQLYSVSELLSYRSHCTALLKNNLFQMKLFLFCTLIAVGLSAAKRKSWENIQDVSAVYAVQGRRSYMEDRFVIDENVNKTGISLFAIFDGHGGNFAAVFAKHYLVQSLYNKIIDISNIVRGINSPLFSQAEVKCPYAENDENAEANESSAKSGGEKDELSRATAHRRSSTTDHCTGTKKHCSQEHEVFLNKLNPMARTNERLLKSNNSDNVQPQTFEAKCYVDKAKEINFGKMITDEVLAADYKLVQKAKQQTSKAGTTALIAIFHGTRLIVANVGDSRGVMCDSNGNAIPLSFDHKPEQSRESKRIREAGGFIAFKGVWRVAGILATSRALGDFELKEKNLVIAEPDILTFDLADHRPKFLILASDGLWDTFSNEEAVSFIRDRLDEVHFGAKSIALKSYARGSEDNITVMVIVFKDGKYHIGKSTD